MTNLGTRRPLAAFGSTPNGERHPRNSRDLWRFARLEASRVRSTLEPRNHRCHRQVLGRCMGTRRSGCVDCSRSNHWRRPRARGLLSSARGTGTRYCHSRCNDDGPSSEALHPDLPVIAHLLEHNHASSRVAEICQLPLQHRPPAAGNPDPNAIRLIYADRALSSEQLDAALA